LKHARTIGIAVAALVAAGLGAWASSVWRQAAAPTVKSGVLLQQPRPLAEFSLVDQDGRPFTRASLQGGWTLLFAGYTHCPDICPTTLALMKALEQKLAADGRAVRMVFLSVDPARDTPQRLKEYVRAFSPNIEGVSGPTGQLDVLCRSLGLAYTKVPETGAADYSMDHSAALTLLNPRGEIAGYFQPPLQLDALAADLATVVPARA
jgi:protein SCO1/2